MRQGSCCHNENEPPVSVDGESCHIGKKRFDYIFWVSCSFVLPAYLLHLLLPQQMKDIPYLSVITSSSYEMINTMWWGIALGILFIGILGKIPREIVLSVLGRGGTFKGVLRATLAGVLIDMCSHGILLVGAKLYERGASIGQMVAFLVASPWNSFSLTIILWSLVGFKWMILFLILSGVVAIISGYIFDILVKKRVLPDNPNKISLPDDFNFRAEFRKNILGKISFSPSSLMEMIISGAREARMLIRWLLFGVMIAVLIRTFISQEYFHQYFGPSMLGLLLTIIAATIIEVCSEGSVPIAADILNRAGAPGNSFAFLLTGVSTDYTEIMILREATKSWKIAFFLPLITVPQVVFISWLINMLAG